MRKVIIASLGFIIIASCVYKRGSGNIITQTKTTGPFKGLEIAGGFEVEIKNGPTENVVVEADDNLMKYIDVKVVDNELRVRLEQINISDAHLKIFITAPEVNKVIASAGAEINVKDALKSAGTINVKASSGSNIKTALDAPGVKADVSSGGEITLSGRTKDIHASSSSGSSIEAAELLSENSYVTASSGGSVHVNASVSVDASASSGGNISYRGAATAVKKSESSGGEVSKDN
ncbi:MAG: head GIN domain-containing protein [Ferruginibacter sp.]